MKVLYRSIKQKKNNSIKGNEWTNTDNMGRIVVLVNRSTETTTIVVVVFASRDNILCSSLFRPYRFSEMRSVTGTRAVVSF